MAGNSHRVFDGVVDDQVVAAEWKPGSHCHKVSVLQRARTFPFKQHTPRKHVKTFSCCEMKWDTVRWFHFWAVSLKPRGELTGVISNICVDRQSADVVRVDHVGVPLPAVTGVMEDVVQCLCHHVFTHYPHLGHKQREQPVINPERAGYWVYWWFFTCVRSPTHNMTSSNLPEVLTCFQHNLKDLHYSTVMYWI